jgi:hypothetical protein
MSNNHSYHKFVVPFIDVLFTFLLVFISIMMLINKVKSDNETAQAPKANVTHVITMTLEGDADLDLWVQDSQGHLSGFNNKEGGPGSLMSLNRDCLGAHTTEVDEFGNVVNKVNEEVVSLRGIVEGEYIVNAHGFNLKGSKPPVKALIKITQIKPYKEVVTKEREFLATGDEITFVRFTLDKNGNVTDLNELPASVLRQNQGGQYGPNGEQPPQGQP